MKTLIFEFEEVFIDIEIVADSDISIEFINPNKIYPASYRIYATDFDKHTIKINGKILDCEKDFCNLDIITNATVKDNVYITGNKL